MLLGTTPRLRTHGGISPWKRERRTHHYYPSLPSHLFLPLVLPLALSSPFPMPLFAQCDQHWGGGSQRSPPLGCFCFGHDHGDHQWRCFCLRHTLDPNSAAIKEAEGMGIAGTAEKSMSKSCDKTGSCQPPVNAWDYLPETEEKTLANHVEGPEPYNAWGDMTLAY